MNDIQDDSLRWLPTSTKTTMPAIVCIVGAKNSGKTTFIEAVVPLLKERGLRVGVVKHTHHEVEFDTRGKDSWRHAQAGAEQVALMTPSGVAFFDYRPVDSTPEAMIEAHFAGMDLVLIEGYKWSGLPKIEIFRTAISDRPMCLADVNLRAIVTDTPSFPNLPTFAFDERTAIAEFIVQTICCEKPDVSR